MKLPLIALFCLSATALAQAPKTFKPGDSLLANPHPPIPPNFGWWVEGRPVDAHDAKAAVGAKTTYEYRKEGDTFVAKFVMKDDMAGAQICAHTSGNATKLPHGALIKAGGLVRGNLAQTKPRKGGTVSISIRTNLGKGGETVTYGDQQPKLGAFDWTPIEVVFPVPGNVTDLALLCNVANASGEVEWKNLHVDVAPPGTPVTADFKIKASYSTPEELAAAALEKEKAKQAAEKEQYHIPDPEKIYTPKPALSGPHPRYMFPGLPLAETRARLADPAMKRYRDDLFKAADKLVAEGVPKKPGLMDVEDPLRGYASTPSWLALSYLFSDDAAKKAQYLDAASKRIDAFASWGPCPRDLPNSQMIFGVGSAYDWLYDALPAATKTNARKYLIDCARWMRDPMNNSALQWRTGFWLANHKWFNYAALAMASSVLWGDDAAPLEKNNAEQKLWMDEAMQTFWLVLKTFGPDGAPIEGYNYQSYGLDPYFDFATLADQLTNCPQPFLDNDSIRNLGVSRLQSLLPNHAGFFCYADSTTRSWGGSQYFRYVASHFKDPKSQLLADVMESGEAAGNDVSEFYDETLPDYKTVLAQEKAKVGSVAAPKEAVVIEAETMKLPESYKHKEKNGSHGEAVLGDAPGIVEADVNIPADGFYYVILKYSTGGDTSRSMQIDGKIPFRELSYIALQNSGGWSTEHMDFRAMPIGEDDPKVNAPYLIHMAKGAHKLTWNNEAGGGANLDWFAFVPEGMSKADVLAKIGDTNDKGKIVAEAPIANWRGIFWYDPKIPAAKPESLELYRDNTDLGVYVARSSWTDGKATWFGFKCGPVSGKQVAEIFGKDQTSGHVHPDAGMFSFYIGSRGLVPGANYAHEKLTTNHPVVVIEVTDKKGKTSVTGQYGEGGGWFGSNQKAIQSFPTVLDVQHKPAYHSYLCELGGVYAAAGYPKYRRSITYFPNGAVVIVDKLESAQAETFDFRVLTLSKNMKVSGSAFDFNIGKVGGKLLDLSPAQNEREAKAEVLPSYNNPTGDPPTRNVAILKAKDQTKTIFAAVLGANGAEKGIGVKADDNTIAITGAPGGTVNLGWMNDKQADIPKDVALPKPVAAKK